MEVFLPVRLEQVAKYGRQRFQCPQCEGERYLARPRSPMAKDRLARLGLTRCDACSGAGVVGFAKRAVMQGDDEYATKLLRRVLRGLSSGDILRLYFGVECVDILHTMRREARCCSRRFKTFLGSRDDWARLKNKITRAKLRLNAAKENYFTQVTQQRLDRASLLRELQNEAFERARQAREATRELEDKYLSN